MLQDGRDGTRVMLVPYGNSDTMTDVPSYTHAMEAAQNLWLPEPHVRYAHTYRAPWNAVSSRFAIASASILCDSPFTEARSRTPFNTPNIPNTAHTRHEIRATHPSDHSHKSSS